MISKSLCIFLLFTSFMSAAEKDGRNATSVSSVYKPKSLCWVNWDCPSTAHVGVDVDYKLTGYDWHNRALRWKLVSGPAGMQIDKTGTIHWVPKRNGTTESVHVRMIVGSNEMKIDKRFTIRVNNKLCFFVAPDGKGDDAGNGTIKSPFATIGAAIRKAVELEKQGAVVYLRKGKHTTEWSWYRDGKHFRKMAEAKFTAENPCIFRNYPKEKVRHVLGEKHGWRFYGEHIVLYGIEVEGGASSECGAVILSCNSVGKNLIVHGYHASYKGNPTGFKIGGGVVLDHCLAYDNYDKTERNHHNGSNYLFYGTTGSGDNVDTYIIDSISNGYSPVGYKIKHAGERARLHLHRCVGMGTRTIYGGADNFSSIRHCLFYAKAPESQRVLILGMTDPTTRGEVNLDQGMLVDECVLLKGGGDSELANIWHYCFGSNPNQPAVFRNNTIACIARNPGAAASRNALFSAHARKTPPETFTVKFLGNRWWAGAVPSLIRIGPGKPFSVTELNKFGASRNNTQLANVPVVEMHLAGAKWVLKDRDLEQIRP